MLSMKANVPRLVVSSKFDRWKKFFNRKQVDSTEAEEYEQELIESVEDFSETITREVMVPRIDIATIGGDSDLDKAMAIFLSSGYSRLPVTGKSTDDILGILYLKDVAKVLHESPKLMLERKAAELARKAIFVPESKALKDLLQDMQQSSTHVAVVIDEYGGVAGLVTMEDVIEELVGDIVDEYDREIPDVELIEEGLYRVNARFPLFELGELFEIELEDEDVDSVGGVLTKELGRLPKVGDQVQLSGLELTADRVEGRGKRLLTVVVRLLIKPVVEDSENND
ncbi:MAG: CBS domain-containing protein [Actinobacteria bacterium]|nr:CBS domain-containing protein [Actinomycetota bacterium]